MREFGNMDQSRNRNKTCFHSHHIYVKDNYKSSRPVLAKPGFMNKPRKCQIAGSLRNKVHSRGKPAEAYILVPYIQILDPRDLGIVYNILLL